MRDSSIRLESSDPPVQTSHKTPNSPPHSYPPPKTKPPCHYSGFAFDAGCLYGVDSAPDICMLHASPLGVIAAMCLS